MHVIGHQGVGVQGAAFFVQCLASPMQVGVVVLFGEEAGLTVVPSLHDVQRDFINVDAGAAGHGLQPDALLRQVVLALRHEIGG